jgi:hypothetical protein
VQALAERRDRPLAGRLDEREPAAGLPRPSGDVCAEPQALQLQVRALAHGVLAEGREEGAVAREPLQLDGGDRAAAGRLLPPLERVGDLPGPGQTVDEAERHPLDVSEHGSPHPEQCGILSACSRSDA